MWVYMGILCHAFKKNDEWIMAWIFFGMIIVCYIGLINLLCMGILNVCCLAPLYLMGCNGCWISSGWGKFWQSVRNKIVDFNSRCIVAHNTFNLNFHIKNRLWTITHVAFYFYWNFFYILTTTWDSGFTLNFYLLLRFKSPHNNWD